MNNFSLKSYLTSNLNLPEDDMHLIQSSCNIREYAKGDFLLQKGAHCTHAFFVESGLLRQYITDGKGKEHILNFAPESWFVTDTESVYLNEPSAFAIQALESTRVALIDDKLIRRLEDAFPQFRNFNNLLLHHTIQALQSRVLMLMSLSADERYLSFIETYPDILLRVPQTMVASYLGITPESLSRIRKELARQNFNPLRS
ncbi:MAG: Crp/Fnr family transcriptional regulator [Mangrovibacterium sp.]